MGTRPKSPSFFWETSSFFVRFNLTSFAQYLRAVETRGGVAQACRAAPSGDEDVRKCCPREPCCTLGRRRCTKVLPKGAVLYPRATIKYESVAQGSRAALLGDEDVRKCCPREPCCTLGRRRCTKVLPKGAVLHSWATISVVFVAEGFPSSILHSALRPWATGRRGSVAQACRAALSGDDIGLKCCLRWAVGSHRSTSPL